ncbi:MAG: type I glutamate--ammonia ligase [Candidatus Edwardsbacteria bacterium]|jgi:glutamine synthetase|nr:type I glutamate--ammonia ligase [Candidatus Edwardsbacteria bacterium]
MNIKQIMADAKKNHVAFVAVRFVDLVGKWHQITVPAHELKPDLFQRGRGIGFDGSSVAGFTQVKAGDMIVIPVPETAVLDPFAELPTLSFIGDVIDVATGEKFERNPRFVAEKAEAHLRKSGYAEQSFWGPEFEFYLFDSIRFENQPQHSYFRIDAAEAHWNTGRDERPNLGNKIPHKGGYHAAPPQDRYFDFRSALCRTMEQCGIPVKYHHHEVGGAGQMEIEVMFDTLTRMADRTMMVKHIVHNGAAQAGLTATFMPKPLVGEPGNGMHVHQYLARGGHSLFYKKGGLVNMSDLALHYLGGLLHHAPALLAFTNPSTNSYRRLVPGFEAPVKASYSVGNRTAAVRIPGYLTDPRNFRYEFRPPDATCNPYLAFAAMLMAGIDGIRRKLDPGQPLNKDLFSLAPRDLERIPTLPTSLPEALEALRRDHRFLLEGGVFPEDLITTWIDLKSKEFAALNIRPHPYEFQLYYDC